MTTTVGTIAFTNGANITVRQVDGSTYPVTAIDFQVDGVMMEYIDDGNSFRTFVPYGKIEKIYEALP
jgi:hypothetical protein